MLSYSGHESGGVMVLSVEEAAAGDGLLATREWLYKTVGSREDPRFILDLGAVHYMASADIGVLITLQRRIAGRKGRLVVTNVDPYIVDTLHTMRIATMFTIASDMPAAVAALSA